jgi:hypothetical protein
MDADAADTEVFRALAVTTTELFPAKLNSALTVASPRGRPGGVNPV